MTTSSSGAACRRGSMVWPELRDRRFHSRSQDHAAIGNILREASVDNLSAETSASKGALREPNEDCQDDRSSFDIRLAYRRSMYAWMVGYWRTPDANQCRCDARQKCNRIVPRRQELACSICSGYRFTPVRDELQSDARLFAA
jgi:hypothetical protein